MELNAIFNHFSPGRGIEVLLCSTNKVLCKKKKNVQFYKRKEVGQHNMTGEGLLLYWDQRKFVQTFIKNYQYI